jgi:hypothetical protein
MTPLASIPTADLVAELRKRKDVCCAFDIGPGEPFEITIDAEEYETPWCEGPGILLMVFE